MVVNNYRQGDFTPYLFHTKDFGKTWTNLLASNRPDGMGHCLSVLQDPAQPSLVYLGTETGLFISANGGKNWQRWSGLPVMPVQDLAIQEREGDLILGTFGRAAWVLDDLRPLREAAAAKGRVLTAYDAPDAYHWIYAESDGIRFQGHAMFQGAAADRLNLFGHYLASAAEKVSVAGVWATCGCSAPANTRRLRI